MMDCPRATFRAWFGASGWSWNDVPTAMRSAGLSHIPTATALRLWATEGGMLRPDYQHCVMRLVVENPEPGPADDFKTSLADRYRRSLLTREQEIQRRREEVEQQRSKWRHEHLARERMPRRAERGPLAGLDRQTVIALRGF